MTRGQIESELRTYREKSARLAVLQTRAVEIEHTILELRAKLDDPSGVGAAVIDGMPHAQPVSSVVERQVIRCDRDTDEIRELQHELERVQTMAYRVGQEVAIVEAWLLALDERERFAVRSFYFDGLFWGTIRRRYEDEYKMPISDRRVKQLRDRALGKMERVSA
jgi:DNA-directed RNA polymerase specialized sigma subunit